MTIAASFVLTATSSFNSDFYLATATIIPVLFLALAVQSRDFVLVFRAYQRLGHTPAGEQGVGSPVAALWRAASVLLLFFLSGIVIATALGELLAVYDLYQRRDQSGTRQVIVVATIFLIIAVGAVSIASFVGGLARTRPQNADATIAGTDAQSQEEGSARKDVESAVRKVDTVSDDSQSRLIVADKQTTRNTSGIGWPGN